jgi:hypothetical protein
MPPRFSRIPKPNTVSDKLHRDLLLNDALLRPVVPARRFDRDRRGRPDRRREEPGLAGVAGLDRRVMPRRSADVA